MSPACLPGRYAGGQATPVHWRSTQTFVDLIKWFQCFYTTEERDRFNYLKRSLSSAYIMANGDTCPQGDAYQKPVTEASLGSAIPDIGHSITQTNCEGERTSDRNRAKLGIASAPGKPWPAGHVPGARSGKNLCQEKDLRLVVVAQRLSQLGRKLGLGLIQLRHQIAPLVQ
jgi:hypothetical protein